MQQPRHRHAAAKAWACGSQGCGNKARARSSQGQGMQQPRHGHAAAKAKAAPHGQAAVKSKASSSEGMGKQQRRHGHAGKAKACCQCSGCALYFSALRFTIHSRSRSNASVSIHRALSLSILAASTSAASLMNLSHTILMNLMCSTRSSL
nr:hypothetical protein CFP56_74858 [Quercus suber]